MNVMHMRRWTRALGAVIVAYGLLSGMLAGQALAATDLNAQETQKLLGETSGLVVLDVRTPGEYAEGHLPGAVNIDFGSADFAARVKELRGQNTGPWVVYCRTGRRSAAAVPALERLGVTPLYHFTGGITMWPYAVER